MPVRASDVWDRPQLIALDTVAFESRHSDEASAKERHSATFAKIASPRRGNSSFHQLGTHHSHNSHQQSASKALRETTSIQARQSISIPLQKRNRGINPDADALRGDRGAAGFMCAHVKDCRARASAIKTIASVGKTQMNSRAYIAEYLRRGKKLSGFEEYRCFAGGGWRTAEQ
jgi:hypothetical protein